MKTVLSGTRARLIIVQFHAKNAENHPSRDSPQRPVLRLNAQIISFLVTLQHTVAALGLDPPFRIGYRNITKFAKNNDNQAIKESQMFLDILIDFNYTKEKQRIKIATLPTNSTAENFTAPIRNSSSSTTIETSNST